MAIHCRRKADRIVVDAEDALIAALKAKADQPGATIMYVRRSNRRGDTRHPPRTHTGGPLSDSKVDGQPSGRRLK